MAAEPTAVEYIGKDGAFIPGVPAEDHIVDTKAEATRLVEATDNAGRAVYRLASKTKAAAIKAEAEKPAATPTTEKPDTGEGE
jgi:hypothetical protein